jgi:hypothetical protein
MGVTANILHPKALDSGVCRDDEEEVALMRYPDRRSEDAATFNNRR